MANVMASLNETNEPPKCFWNTADTDLIIHVLTFLSLHDIAAAAGSCRALASICALERFWEQWWPWPVERGGRPVNFNSSWRAAARMQALYQHANTRLERQVFAYDFLLREVTCPCYSASYRVYGYADGTVRVFGRLEDGARHSEFKTNFGSVRHMQILGDTGGVAGPASGENTERNTFTVGTPVRKQSVESDPIAASNNHCSDAEASTPHALAPAPATEQPVSPTLGCPRRAVDGMRVRIYVGSWNGAVSEVCLTHGVVRTVISGLSAPVYGLRIGGTRLYTCCGDGSIHVSA